MTTKRCNVCKEFLPLDNFNKCSASPDGKGYTCIECGKIKCREYNLANRHKRVKKTSRVNRQDSEWTDENGVRTKRCKDCSEAFPVEGSFQPNGKLKDGRPRYQARCIICESIYYKKWYEENRERRAEYSKDRRNTGLLGPKEAEKKKEADKKREERAQLLRWKQENPELVRKERLARQKEAVRKLKEKDPERFRLQQAEARKRFIEKHGPGYYKKAAKKWKQNNRETWLNSVRKRDAIRRARKGGHTPETHHTEDQWQQLLEACGNRCACCDRHQGEAPLTRDHVVPLVKGGSDAITNIQPLCRSCNSMKMTSTDRFIPLYEELFPDERVAS
jgi:hypothetical protein